MKAALAFCLLALFAGRPAAAQSGRAQVTASVTIVESIGVAAGATAVRPGAGETLDVTTPLSIRGSAPRVVQVVDGDRARPIAAQLQRRCAPDRPADADACAVQSRVNRSDADHTVLTYVVATIN